MNERAEIRELATGDGTVFPFRYVALRFEGMAYDDAFGLKNNKSLRETLTHRRYKKLAEEAAQNYGDSALNSLWSAWLLHWIPAFAGMTVGGRK